MKTFCISTLSVGLCAVAMLAPQAKAQAAGSCKGVVAIDSVYQTSKGSGKFEYYVQVRNTKSGDSTVDLRFGEFPKEVTLFSPVLPRIILKPNESKAIRFGMGTNQQINSGSVKVYYDDAMSLPKPYVLAQRCSTISK